MYNVKLVVWVNVKFLYFYMVPLVLAVCMFHGLPLCTLVLPPIFNISQYANLHVVVLTFPETK